MKTFEEREAQAIERAKAIINVGDELLCEGCGSARFTLTFTKWMGDQARGRGRRTAHAASILTVNGEPSGFWEAA